MYMFYLGGWKTVFDGAMVCWQSRIPAFIPEVLADDTNQDKMRSLILNFRHMRAFAGEYAPLHHKRTAFLPDLFDIKNRPDVMYQYKILGFFKTSLGPRIGTSKRRAAAASSMPSAWLLADVWGNWLRISSPC